MRFLEASFSIPVYHSIAFDYPMQVYYVCTLYGLSMPSREFDFIFPKLLIYAGQQQQQTYVLCILFILRQDACETSRKHLTYE